MTGKKTQAIMKNPFDKYFYYKQSVQSPKQDIRFFQKIYKDGNNELPQS